MTINWQEFDKPVGDFNRWKPENEGDKITGVVKSVRIATMPDGNRYPSITISSNGTDYDVLASQTLLLRLLAEKQPQPGDTIAIHYTRLEKLVAGKTMKHFHLEVIKGKPTTAEDII
jgi:hypothetical protein